jgi:hypothetical protein
MYTPQKLASFQVDGISRDSIVTIDAARLYDPETNGQSGKEIRFLSDGQAMRSTVCFGPYISLRAGFYVARLHGEMTGSFEVRFTRNKGQHILASQVIRAIDDALFFTIPDQASDFEIVVATTRDSMSFDLDRVELYRMTEREFSATKLLTPQLHEIAFLQNEPPLTNPGFVKGRNIRAGYLRGTYIASGAAQAILRDPDWIAAQEAAEGRSIAAPNHLLNLFLLIKYSPISGNIIEFGAFRGGTSLMIAALLKRLGSDRKVYALDTFAGMPASCDSNLDMHVPGGFSEASYEELVEVRDRRGLDNLVILKGLFEDTIDQIPREERRFFLAHVDCDIYDSVKFSINYTAAYAVKGAYLVFDDPLVFDCLGAFQAVEEELVQKRGLFAEQAYPHLVYRCPIE